MSDIMKSIPFGQLTEWILNEYKKTVQVLAFRKLMWLISQKQSKYSEENLKIR